MNYLLTLPPPLKGDSDDLTGDSALQGHHGTIPFNIPFTNQQAFQDSFTPEGFSFDLGYTFTPMTNTTTTTNVNQMGMEDQSHDRPRSGAGGLESSPNQSMWNQTGVATSSASDVPRSNSLQASTVDIKTGDRFSQLLKAKFSVDPTQSASSGGQGFSDVFAYNAFPNGSSSTEPSPLLSNARPSSLPQNRTGQPGSSMNNFNPAEIERILQDMSQIQVPPDYVVPPLPSQWDTTDTFFGGNPFDPQHAANASTQFPPAHSSLPDNPYTTSSDHHTDMYGSGATQPYPAFPPIVTRPSSSRSSTDPGEHPPRPSSFSYLPPEMPDHHAPHPVGALGGVMPPPSHPLPVLHNGTGAASNLPTGRVTDSRQPQTSGQGPQVPSMDSGWAMQLLQGYKNAQAGLHVGGWGQFSRSPTPSRQHPNALSHLMTPPHSVPAPANSSLRNDARRSMTGEPLARHSSSYGTNGMIPEPLSSTHRRSAKSMSSERNTKNLVDTSMTPTPQRQKALPDNAEGTPDDKKVVIACHMCRSRKLKCDGARPKCHHCTRRNESVCEYDAVLRRRGPGKNNKRDRAKRRSRKKQDSNGSDESCEASPSGPSLEVDPRRGGGHEWADHRQMGYHGQRSDLWNGGHGHPSGTRVGGEEKDAWQMSVW